MKRTAIIFLLFLIASTLIHSQTFTEEQQEKHIRDKCRLRSSPFKEFAVRTMKPYAGFAGQGIMS